MEMELILNELSLQEVENAHVARKLMRDFISTIRAATKQGMKRTLRTHDDVYGISLAPDYPIRKWLNDNEADREERRLFRSLATKAPFLIDITDDSITDRHGRTQFSFQDRDAIGLGIAYLLGTLAISLHTESHWENEQIEISVQELNQEITIDEYSVNIFHACSVEHVQIHVPWIKKRLQEIVREAVESGITLWQQRQELFPHLQFSTTAERQLQAIPSGDIHLPMVLRRFNELEQVCRDWTNGSFPFEKILHATPESNATLQTYAQEHTFRCPNGNHRIFNWHVRLTPEAWRIYFIPDDDTHTIIVGHIGHHLPTILFPK